MHNIKDIRNNLNEFKKLIQTRNTDIDLSTYELQKDWIQKNVNGFTNALRGILNRFKDELSI